MVSIDTISTDIQVSLLYEFKILQASSWERCNKFSYDTLGDYTHVYVLYAPVETPTPMHTWAELNEFSGVRRRGGDLKEEEDMKLVGGVIV